MIRRRTASVTLIEPPTPKEREVMARCEVLATQRGTEAERAQLAAALETTETRWMLAALNTLQYGRYEANRRAVIAWIEAQLGKPWAEAAKDPAAGDLIDAGLRWARIAATVQMVEERTVSRVTDAAGEWGPVAVTGLESIEAFLDAYSGDLAGALDEVVYDLNPGLFGARLDSADAKKNGGINAG